MTVYGGPHGGDCALVWEPRAEREVDVQGVVRVHEPQVDLPPQANLRVHGGACEMARADVVEREARPLPPVPRLRPHLLSRRAGDHAIVALLEHAAILRTSG